MKYIYIIVVVLAFFLVGCMQPTQTDMQEDMNVEEAIESIPEEVLEAAQEDIAQTVDDQIIFEDENVTISVEDGSYVARVESGVDFESAPFSQWCISGEVYTIESDEGDVQAVISGITQYRGEPVCQVEHTTTQEYVGEIQTTYYISEDSRQIWIVSTMMGQTTESYVDLR